MKHLLRIDRATHALTVLFGLTSLANVNSFLVGAGHDWLAATALSGALGAALIVVSIALTKIDYQTERSTFWALATVGGLLALISGALQSAEYATHLSGAWPFLLGYGVPVVGEIGLSLACALFVKAQSRSELRAVHSKMSSTVTTALDDALATFDTSQIRKRIDRSLNGIAARAVDGVTAELLAFYGDNQPMPPATIDAETVDNTHIVQTPEALSQARTDKKLARMQEFQRLADGTRTPAEVAQLLGVTTKTVGRYADELRIPTNGVVGICLQ